MSPDIMAALAFRVVAIGIALITAGLVLRTWQ